MKPSFYNIEPLAPYLAAGDLVFTPNFRLARQVKAEWDRSQAANRQRWPAASVLPLEQWLLQQWRAARSSEQVASLALLDDLAAREIWLQVIAQDQSHHSDYSLLQGGAAAEQAMHAYSHLYRWQVPVQAANISAQFGQDQDCATYLRWHRSFEQRVGALGMIHPVAALSQLRDSIDTPVIKRAALLDFDELPPLFLACINKLSSVVERLDSGKDQVSVAVAACDDRKAELAAAAQWAAQAYRDNPEQTVGIVLTDMDNDRGSFEIHLRRAFDCLGDNYNALPVNFSTGIGLDRAPVVRDALLMLGATRPSVNLPDVVQLLQSRFNRCEDGRSDIAVRLISELYNDGQATVTTALLRQRAQEIAIGDRQGLVLGSILYELMAMRLERKKQLPSAWVDAWVGVLEIWGWPGAGDLDSLEYQQVERWYASLEEFAALDAVLGKLELAPALAALERSTRGRISQPQTADSNVQVLGTLEAAGLHFDRLWITGLQASRWPPPPRPNPFVPFTIQHDAGFPHACVETEWQYRHALVMRFRRSAREVVCSYRMLVDTAVDHPSPLIADLPVIEPNPGRSSFELWLDQRNAHSVEELLDEQAPALSAQRLESIRGGSAIVEDQSNCGFRAFARRRLYLEPLGEYRNALSAAERGSLMHAALQALWGRLETSAALATIDDECEAGLAAQTALEGLRSNIRQRVGMACLELEQQRLQALLCEWLALERARPPFTVAAREEVLQTSLQGLPLTMRLDRRDTLEEGGELVIDYKSSSNSLGQWLGERPAKPQLPLYLVASGQSTAIAFAEVKAGKCSWRGLGNAEGIPGVLHEFPKATARYASFDSWDALLTHWHTVLHSLVTAFVSGDAAVDPLPKACDYCGLQSVCRIGLNQDAGNSEQDSPADMPGIALMIADSAQRQRALDWTHSFCVTAPAGSGKTELLIQRFLGLLSRVERPEQVLAITFTRKAAAEMRDRVLQALHNARDDSPVVSDHEHTTRQLAMTTLAHAQGRGWQLLRDASSLNIRTIDGFCAGLTRQMPVLSGFGGAVHTVDDATELYGRAVDELFSLVGSNHAVAADLAELLLSFDNNWDRLRSLLTSMLARRDQWRDYIGVHRSPEESESQLLANVSAVIEDQLQSLHASLSPYFSELGSSFRYAQNNLHGNDSAELPTPSAQALPQWRELITLLLTGGNAWRKQVTVREGFPAGKGAAQDSKDRHMGLISTMSSGDASLLEQLTAVRQLPDIHDNTGSWQLVLKLSHVLPTLAACLLLVFKEEGSVDHTQVAMSALDALGDEDSPTDLALRLDYRYEHILVDEFQDTAINQYNLIDKLTRGWGEHNALNPDFPRTLFIVGDGMQSIYGFRDANVGLFLKAREHGFNGVVPETLELKSNFRSDHGIVSWVNDTFVRAFPASSDASKGQVSYSSAVAVRTAELDPAVECHAFYGHAARQGEAEFLLSQIRHGLDNMAVQSIAVLGRSRSHLAPLIALLQAQDIPFATQDMTPLAGSAAIVDLMSLCSLLANPADRVALFGVLRAPWCGMTLADLDVLGQIGDEPRYAGINNLLDAAWQPAIGELLSADGVRRFRHLAAALTQAQRQQDRLALRVWIEQCWLQLGGPGTLADTRQFEDAERFFELLEEAERDGFGLDREWLSRRLEKLYAAGGSPDEKLQIMTLHRAKGLEFDWVLIPGLGRIPRSQDRDVLLWDDYTNTAGRRSFLLAADDGSDAKLPTLYNFLSRQRKRKSQLESTRLLYVGATRAVSRLLLTSELKSEDKEDEVIASMESPPEASLLASIWPMFSAQIQLHAPADALPVEPGALQRTMRRLADVPEAEAVVPATQAGGNVPERSLNRLDRHVGTIVHLALEQLAQSPILPDNACTESVRTTLGSRRSLWRAQLLELGLAGELLERACERVEISVSAVLNDPTGRWILDSQHDNAACELALTASSEEDKVVDLIVDRTFVDQAENSRWIIDYKTSQPAEGESMKDFLARESALYTPQIQRYALALYESEGPSLRCALYFTSIPCLHELSVDVEAL